MVVDAHHHFWNPARVPQPWLRGVYAALDRPFEPPDLEPLLRSSGVEMTVLVQSACDDRDTDYLFEAVDGVDWVGAVVAWVDLTDARARLRELAAQPKFRGIRHLINTEPDPHWILRRPVAGGLEVLQDAGLVLELPAEFPNHLEDVPELARRYPGLTIVIDHLAKPPLGSSSFAQWREQLSAAAAHPNVRAKVSGLDTLRPDLESVVDAAVAAFGPGRLIFGSDWPMSLLIGTYAEVTSRTIDVVRAVAGDGADAILGGTAAELYAIS
jgi:L-fuconolactonase